MRRIPSMGPVLLVAAALLAAACSVERDQRLYDLAHSLPIAVQRHEERDFDLGTPEARAAMIRGWSWNEKTEDGTPFVWGLGVDSALELFLLERRPLELRMRAFAHPALTTDGSLSVAMELNGVPLGSIDLGETFSEAVLPVASEAQRLGNNLLTLRPSTAVEQADRKVSVAWDRITLGAPGSEQPLSAQALFEGLLLPAGIQVAWPLELGPEQELLLAGVALPGEVSGASVGLRVMLESGDHSEPIASIDDDVLELRVPLPVTDFSPAWLYLQTPPGQTGAVKIDRAWIVRATKPAEEASRALSADRPSGEAHPDGGSPGRP